MEFVFIIITIIVVVILLLSMLASVFCYKSDDEEMTKFGLKAQWVASVSLIILIALVLFMFISE